MQSLKLGHELYFTLPLLHGWTAVGSMSDIRDRGPGFDTRFGHILSYFLPLSQEGQFQLLANVCA